MIKNSIHFLELPPIWNHGSGSTGVPRSKKSLTWPTPGSQPSKFSLPQAVPESMKICVFVACLFVCLFLINLLTSARACLSNYFLLVDEASLSHFRLTSGLEFKINVVLILRHDASLALSKLALLENTITHLPSKLQIQSHAYKTIPSLSRCLSNYSHCSVSLTALELPYC